MRSPFTVRRGVRARRTLWLVVVVAALATSCGLVGGANGPAHIDLHGSTDRLVSRFNADTGKVRAVFVASPT